MKIVKFLVVLFFAQSVILVLNPVANACSRIFYNKSAELVVGRSTDWDVPLQEEFYILPRGLNGSGGIADNAAKWTSKYGSLYIVSRLYNNAGVEGINEKGFTAHLLYQHETKYENRDNRPGISYANWLRYMLDNFATVQEAVAGLEKVQVVSVSINGQVLPIHMALEDATGNSAIIEFVNGKMVIQQGRQYAVMTNEPLYADQIKNLKQYITFGGNKPIPGNIEATDRFVRASYFLKYMPKPENAIQAVTYMFSVIRSVAVPFGAPYSTGTGAGTYPTWWVSVTDIPNRIYYFSATTLPNVIWLDLNKFNLAAGTPIMKFDPENPASVGDVSHNFTPGNL